MSETLVIVLSVVGALILLTIIGLAMYVKASPQVAIILSGLKKEPRILIGRGGFKVPFVERMDKLYIGQLSVDVKTTQPVPTNDFIDVLVDGVCKVQVDPKNVRIAAKNFLNMNPEQISSQIKDSLEGNMREVIGAIPLQTLVNKRDAFSDQIQSKAGVDMAGLGLEIISCNVQSISDKNGLIQGLGADNTMKIRKEAAITKANAERDIEIATANAEKEANDVKVKTQTEIAERNNELAIKKAELQKISDTKKAEADAAYEIQKQEQQKTINIKTVDAQIEQTKREQILAEESIRVTENQLKAQVNAQADSERYQIEVQSDAEKYQVEVQAKAVLEQQKRKAEAEAYMAEQAAKAVRAKAEAAKYAALQEAEGIAAKGHAEAEAKQAVLEAEAAGILAKGQAEAEAMDKKAEAYKRSEFAKLEMITGLYKSILPEMAANVAAPMGNIEGLRIYGGSAASVSGTVPEVMKQTMDVVKDVTGVDMADIMKSNTINAKTDKNITVTGDIDGLKELAK